MSTDRPIVFLAFADARSDLSALKVEGWSLKDQFDELKRRGVIADVVVEEKASLERIYPVFQKYRDRIALFHFGGHADGDRLLLQSAFEPREAYAEGLATLLGQQRGLKLVFLNGCSTRPQVKRLLDAGVPTVIATARPIVDTVATEFAVAFYQALTTGYSGEKGEIKGGCSLATAFAQAEGLIKAARGGNPRDLVAATPNYEDVTDDNGFPWVVQYRKGSEHVARWNLFEDDPLFGLPDLPADVGWPVEPYRNLEYFRRDDARIFFGRGRAIRELYDLLTLPAESAESRLIFYYGQTGVGKTSVLAAGLLPRLETLFAPRYCRRSAQDGLLGTLRATLAPGAKPFDLSAAWLEIEDKARRPLVIVLDQAEEAFTKPLADLRPKEEIRALFEAVREAFAPTRTERPSGRLILSFRKEWLAEFNEIRKASNLDIKPKMLEPLDRSGVIEAIEGPADHFGLAIKPDRNDVKPGQPTLAEFMADGLFNTLADPKTEQESPIAPTLQILVARMWKEANDPKRLRGQPTFDGGLYQELKTKGFKLDEVIQEQFDKITKLEGLSEAVEKGLLLDLLEFFTTREGTADPHMRQQIHDRYKHQPPKLLDDLLEACKSSYLLADVGVGADGTAAYRLTHDTLAPLLRERFRVSPALAQRARRLLEGRGATWKGQTTDPVLNDVDLRSVEEGLSWMRGLVKDEHQDEPGLLDASRRAKDEQEQQFREAREREEKARRDAEERLKKILTQSGIHALEQGYSFEAMHLFAQAVVTLSSDVKAQADNRLRLSFLGPGHVPALGSILEHANPVRSAAFSPDSTRLVTASDDGTTRVWNAADGQLIAELKGHTGDVNSAAFSPDGTRLVTASRDQTARVWNAADGSLIAELKGHTGDVNSAAFSPDGTRLVTASDDDTARIWNAADGSLIAELKGHADTVWSAAFSPDGTQVVTASSDRTARVWNAADNKLIAELKGHANWVNSAAFSPDGTRLVTASTDQTARVWNAADNKLIAELRGHTDWVNSAAFSPDGTRVVTASADQTARVWNAADGAFIAELKGHTDWVNSAAFSPDGTRVVTASSDTTVRVWPLEPLKGDARTIPLWVQAFTGTDFQAGTISPLSNAEWKQRCRELRAHGDRAPPSPWLDGLDLTDPTRDLGHETHDIDKVTPVPKNTVR